MTEVIGTSMPPRLTTFFLPFLSMISTFSPPTFTVCFLRDNTEDAPKDIPSLSLFNLFKSVTFNSFLVRLS